MLQKTESTSDIAIPSESATSPLPPPGPMGLAIQKSINDYLASNPNRSLRGIAMKDDFVNREYVRRLAAGEIPDAKLNPEKVLRVLQIIFKKNTIKELIEQCPRELTTLISSTFKVVLDNSLNLASAELDQMLTDVEDSSVVYALCALEKGASTELITSVVGSRGLDVLENLVKKGFVKNVNNSYHCFPSKNYSPSINTARKNAQVFLRYYRLAHIGQKWNYMLNITEGLNEEGIKVKQDLYREFHDKLTKLHSDDRYKGNIPCFSIAFTDSFTVRQGEDHV